MSITKQVRDEAATFLLVMHDMNVGFLKGRAWFAPSWAAERLAQEAWDAVWRADDLRPVGAPRSEEWLEASSLLLDGWRPGQKVVRHGR